MGVGNVRSELLAYLEHSSVHGSFYLTGDKPLVVRIFWVGWNTISKSAKVKSKLHARRRKFGSNRLFNAFTVVYTITHAKSIYSRWLVALENIGKCRKF
jgi:hypothetical protein